MADTASMNDAIVTRDLIASELQRLGVRSGDTLLVHASMGALGWVCGGPVAVVHALRDAVGDTGTVVVPAQTTSNTDPSTWTSPAVPPDSWPAIREHMPAFDPRFTPSRGMGAIAECVRTWPGALRSPHPQTSFAALGPRAAYLMAEHPLESQLGEESPLGRLEECDARVLLLGVGFDKCTAFHLAEYRMPAPPMRSLSCAIQTAAGRRWVSYRGVALDATDFTALGQSFVEYSDEFERHPIGRADACLFPVRSAVSFATKWITENR